MAAKILPAILVVLCFTTTVRAESMSCTENGCTTRLPALQRPPSSLLRVVNRIPQSDGSMRIDKGSGIIVKDCDRNWVFTASHIFREGTGEIYVTTTQGRSFGTSILYRNEEWDIVILRTPEGIKSDSVALASTPPGPGEPTTAWGFGSDGKAAGRRGAVVGYVRMKNNGSAETLQTTGRAREGDSGGPVLDRRGELVGLLWGTDGHYTYSTCSERLKTILEQLESATRKSNENKEDRDDLPQQTPLVPSATIITSPGWLDSTWKTAKEWIFSVAVKNAAAALGLGTPAGLLLYGLHRLLRRRPASRMKKMTEEKTASAISLNDAYASQLNALYELSGHSTTADATLGRLYDIKLRDAEQSSSDEISRLAKLLRKQVADQFFRIHSTNPPPAEPKQ